jgi:hypothetical protein
MVGVCRERSGCRRATASRCASGTFRFLRHEDCEGDTDNQDYPGTVAE